MRLWPKRFVDDERSNLGNILLKMGAVTRKQLEDAAEVQKKSSDKPRLGDLLVAAGAITREGLEQALGFQKQMRNGRAADAMLKIVEGNTAKHHARMHQIVQSMAIMMPVVMTNLVGVGYLMFNTDFTVVSAVDGPWSPGDHREEGAPERFIGDPVRDLVSQWLGGDNAVDEHMKIYERCLEGERTEMLLALHGLRMRVEWVPVTDPDGDIVGGVVYAQSPDPLVKMFQANEDTSTNPKAKPPPA